MPLEKRKKGIEILSSVREDVENALEQFEKAMT